MVKQKTKKKALRGKSTTTRKMVDASVLGIAPEQLLGRAADPPINLPMISAPSPATGRGKGEGGGRRIHPWHRPLVSGRTSFWLGVGFGIFVTGVLAYLAWRLYSVEIAEAIVLGLGV